jgi:DNA replication initiation complex subunit (GINS family)
VLEKNELIDRVSELVDDERRRLERQRVAEDREAAEVEAARRAREREKEQAEKETRGEEGGAEGAAQDEQINIKINDPSPSGSTPPAEPARPVPTGPAPEIDRGLCVVCQDEEATLAVVDCGHLAMCQRA